MARILAFKFVIKIDQKFTFQKVVASIFCFRIVQTKFARVVCFKSRILCFKTVTIDDSVSIRTHRGATTAAEQSCIGHANRDS